MNSRKYNKVAVGGTFDKFHYGHRSLIAKAFEIGKSVEIGVTSNAFAGLLFFASKSTDKGDYVEYFKDIFYQEFNSKQIKAIKDKIIKEDATVVFEVIDNINDPHIIEYQKKHIILLDIIYNKTNYSKLSYDELRQFTDANNIQTKQLIYVANDKETFKQIYENITSKDYKFNDNYIEGFVIEDNNNLMVKTKTFYYEKWKYLRAKMESALKNNNYKSKSNDLLEIAFLKYLQSKYENKEIDLKKINIINERNEFQNSDYFFEG